MDMLTSQEFFVGVLSGVVASVILWLAKQMIMSALKITGRGSFPFAITGTWLARHSFTNEKGQTGECIELYRMRQTGFRVQATIHQYNYIDGSYYIFTSCGIFKGERLCLSYGAKGEHSNHVGALVLRGYSNEPHERHLNGFYCEIYINGQSIVQPIELYPESPLSIKQKVLMHCNPNRYLAQR